MRLRARSVEEELHYRLPGQLIYFPYLMVKKLSEIVFSIKVFSIHPAYDHQGTEYVCVEFGCKPLIMPTMVPAGMPRDVSDMIEASKSMMKILVPPQLRSQLTNYANRLTIFLTNDEWNNLQQKYTVGDEFKVIMRTDGSLLMAKI